MPKKIKARCIDAKYYPDQRSIVLVLEDWESHRPVKTAQISSSAFTFGGRDVDKEMEKLAYLYKNLKYPINVVEGEPDIDPGNIELPEPWMIPFFGAKGQ